MPTVPELVSSNVGNAISNHKTWGDIIKNVKEFGADGNGEIDDTAAIQRTINSLGQKGGVVYIPYGKFKISEITITQPNIVLRGEGTLYNGKLTIGSYSVIKKLDCQIIGVKFEYSSLAAGNVAIQFQNVIRVRISNCTFINTDKTIYGIPTIATSPEYHHSEQIRIYDNEFINVNYNWCFEKHPSVTTDPYGDTHFINNQCREALIYGVWGEGMDGLVMTNNTMFFPGSGAHSAIKKNNIYLKNLHWGVISNNNLFEAGEDAIVIDTPSNTEITGNNIAWCGQRVPGSGIKLLGTDLQGGSKNNVIVSNNVISRPSLHGIEVNGQVGDVTINGNGVQLAGPLGAFFYYGTIDLNSMLHYGLNIGSTGKNIHAIGNSSPDNDWVYTRFNLYENYVGYNYDKNKNPKPMARNISLTGTETSIDVTQFDFVHLAQSAATTIVSFPVNTTEGAVNDKRLLIHAFNGNTTLKYDVNYLILKGGINVTLPSTGIMEFRWIDTHWYEISRNF